MPRDDEWTTTYSNVVSESGTKHDEGKPRMELLPTEALTQIAKVLAFGASKYGEHNYRGGLKYSRLIGAAMRHLTAYNDGEDLDPETGLSHLAHAACCCIMGIQMAKERPDCDDRYKGTPSDKSNAEENAMEEVKRGLSFLEDPFGMTPTEKEPT